MSAAGQEPGGFFISSGAETEKEIVFAGDTGSEEGSVVGDARLAYLKAVRIWKEATGDSRVLAWSRMVLAGLRWLEASHQLFPV